jgi:gamma-glutamylcyclotransferase (GGCT)/AIG2-like uncharacterized protein YtfP
VFGGTGLTRVNKRRFDARMAEVTERGAQPAASRTAGQPRGAGRPRRLPAEPGALFAYGTLQFAEVLHALLRRVPEHAPGTITGWRVAALTGGRTYPGMIQAGQATASGMLISGLTPAEWQLIDTYEDDFYELRQLTLTDSRQGWTYAWAAHAEVAPHDWSPRDFAARHLADFAQRCRVWRDRYDATGRPGHVTGHH